MISIPKMAYLRREGHAECVACVHPQLRLDFSLNGPGRIHSSVDLKRSMCSFNGHVHGGILAFLIDEAVTCLLMAEGHYAVTGVLNIRYRHPVAVEPTTHVEATLMEKHGRLHSVQAVIRQAGKECVLANVKMMEEPLAVES